MAYHSKRKKTTRRKKAPKGFHYMPNGKLMKGATHASTKKKKRKKKKKKKEKQKIAEAKSVPFQSYYM